jgi:hypothetical protein
VNLVRRILIGLLLAGAVAASAQDLRVVYLEGLLEVESGGRWRATRLGDAVPGAANVRLSAGGLAELTAGELRVTLHQPGTYSVGALLRTSRQSLAWDLGRLLKSKLQALFRSSASDTSGAMGARAREVEDEDAGWMDEEEDARKADDAAAREVESLLAQGKAAEAAAAAGRGLEKAGPASRPFLLFLLASARCLEGSNAAALQAMELAAVSKEAPYYAEYALLKARLLLEGQAYRDALALFDEVLQAAPAPATAQPAWFLSAFCGLQLGDRAEARRRLEKARDLDPGSELGIKAKEMLGSL